MKTIELQIVTIEKKIYDEKVDSVSLPTEMGEIGILSNHVPLVTNLAEGEIKIEKNKEVSNLTCTGGFAQIQPNKVIVLTDAAEHAEGIDIERAEEAKKKAEETMKQVSVKKPEYGVAAAALRRSLMRLNVAKRARRTKRSVRPENDN
ncbi:MAG: F0F1 ATP synthase subunit epsilon [Parcubacteria group bacterium]|nr:F0F1 ATP synthase subunit epsilon [Parcubacteria group bacterium]